MPAPFARAMDTTAAQLCTARPLMMQELTAAQQNGVSWMHAVAAQSSDLVIQQAELFRTSAGSEQRKQLVAQTHPERREPNLQWVPRRLIRRS